MRITSSDARWVGRRILTFYRAAVVETLAAATTAADPNPRAIDVALPGGIVGTLGQRVPGTPTFVIGREYVLFLGPADGPVDGTGPGAEPTRGIVGFWQGAYEVGGNQSAPTLLPFTHDDTPAVPLPFDSVAPRGAR